MALQVKILVTQASNKESITIADNGTNWGVGGNINVGDVTDIVAQVYERDSTTADYSITFTSDERDDFLTGSGTILAFTNSRWFGETYAPDNFYTVQLDVNTVNTSDSGYFSSILELSQLVYKNALTVSINPLGLAESQPIFASVIDLDSLTRLDESTDPDRKYKWTILYDFAYANITKYY